MKSGKGRVFSYEKYGDRSQTPSQSRGLGHHHQPLENKGFYTTPIPDHPPSSFGSWRWSGMGVVCVVGWGWWWCVGGGLGSVVGGKGKGRGAVGGGWWAVIGSGWSSEKRLTGDIGYSF